MTNGATYLYMHRQHRLEIRRQQQLRDELAEARAELDRLSVWGDFIRLQQQLNVVTAEINELNYGIAIDRLQAIREGIAVGEYGTAFQDGGPELVPILEQAEQSLRHTEKEAPRHLAEFYERAFALLSGLGSSMPDKVSEPATGEADREGDEAAQDEPLGDDVASEMSGAASIQADPEAGG